MTTGELVRWVSGAKAELVQYQLGLHVACGSQTRQCWAVLRYSSKVGADITADLAQVTTRPPQAIGMWSHTSSAAWALATVAGRWCAPDRDFIGCYRAVVGSAQALSRTLAAWAAYLAKS